MKIFCLLLIIVHVLAEQVFNVRDFGATGDGFTLDTAAIVKAISSQAPPVMVHCGISSLLVPLMNNNNHNDNNSHESIYQNRLM